MAEASVYTSNFGGLNTSFQVHALADISEYAGASAHYSLTDTVIFFGADSILWFVGGQINSNWFDNGRGSGAFRVGNATAFMSGNYNNGQVSPRQFTTMSGSPLDLSLLLLFDANEMAGQSNVGGGFNISASGLNNSASTSSNTPVPITFASKNGYTYDGRLGTQIPWDAAFDPAPPAPTPEPASWLLIASALPLLALIGHRQRISNFKSS